MIYNVQPYNLNYDNHNNAVLRKSKHIKNTQKITKVVRKANISIKKNVSL